MINKSIKYIGVILLAYTLNACNEQRMSSSSETTTPVWLAEVGKRDVREIRVDDQPQNQASLQAG